MQAVPRFSVRFHRPRASAWVALLAVAALQLGATSHEASHALTDLADNCHFCLQLDGNYAVNSDGCTHATKFLPVARILEPGIDAYVAARDCIRDARAPPHI